MKGVDKETFLAISSDKKSAGLLYDALTEIYDMVAACDDRFVTKLKRNGLECVSYVFCLAWELLK